MITVIIAAYNAEKTIRRAILSALAEADISEIIVVDDASTDTTSTAARQCDDGSGRLKVLVQDVNAGPSAARNRALRESSAPWVTVLDSDDFILVGRMAGLLAHSDGYDLIADDMYQVDENNVDGQRRLLLGDKVVLPMTVGLTDFVLSNVTQKNRERAELGFIKPLMRRDFLNKHHLTYRENMRLGEDYELYARALGLGVKMIVVGAQGYVSVVRQTSLSSNHSEHDLLQLRNCDDDLMRDLTLTPQAYEAIRQHRISIDCRLQWRLLINAVKEKNISAALRTFTGHPKVSLSLLGQLWEQFQIRILKKEDVKIDNACLNILSPTQYPWTFNGPRNSRHRIERRSFIPFNKISSKIEGITIFNPWPIQNFDFIHAFNRIPLGKKPYIIGFESHLPRAFGMEKTGYFDWVLKSLSGERCRGIFAISEYAKRQFIKQHKNYPLFENLLKKLHVRYPNMPIPKAIDAFDGRMDQVNLVFIGNHFIRKGGVAVLKLAQLAKDQAIPIHIDIISSLQMGKVSWVDPLSAQYLKKCKNMLSKADNITIHGALPNAKVLELLEKSHFSLLPTLSDTFGFSAIESMANFIPVMATPQGALPEFILNGENGFLLPLETDDVGEWIHIAGHNRSSQVYENLFDEECNSLAEAMLSNIKKVIADNQLYLQMRKNSHAKAQQLFCADEANMFWDDIYRSL